MMDGRKLCTYCKWSGPPRNEYTMCKHPKCSPDEAAVTGFGNIHCANARNFDNLCGLSGKHWEAKDIPVGLTDDQKKTLKKIEDKVKPPRVIPPDPDRCTECGHKTPSNHWGQLVFWAIFSATVAAWGALIW